MGFWSLQILQVWTIRGGFGTEPTTFSWEIPNRLWSGIKICYRNGTGQYQLLKIGIPSNRYDFRSESVSSRGWWKTRRQINGSANLHICEAKSDQEGRGEEKERQKEEGEREERKKID